MLFPEQYATLLPWPAWAPTLARFHGWCRGPLPAYRGLAEILPCGSAGRRDAGPSRARLLELALLRLDLNERVVGMHRFRRFVQHCERIRIVVFGRQLSLYRRPESTQAAEGMIHSGSFVTAVYHAVRALRIAGLRAVILPLGGIEQLLERIHIPVLQQVAGLLPAEDVIGRHAPRSASIGSLAHQKLKEQLRLIELPASFAIGQNCAEQPPRASPPEEVLLIGCLVVRIAGGEHHAFDAQFHHLVEERADALGIGAVEPSCVRCGSEALFYCFSDSLASQLVATLTANGKIVMLFLPVHVHGEGQVFAGLEKMKLFFQEQRVGAEIDVLLPR